MIRSQYIRGPVLLDCEFDTCFSLSPPSQVDRMARVGQSLAFPFPHMKRWSWLGSGIFFPQFSWALIKSQQVRLWLMAPHSSTLAWKIPRMEEPGRLQSMGSRRVRHEWATSFSLFTFMHWRRKWQPTPVFLPGESQGQGSLVGCHLWGRTESDTTEAT